MSRRQFLCLSFVALLSLATQVLGFCTNFKQSRNYYTTRSPDEQIISHGYVCDKPNSNYTMPVTQQCNATGECPAQSGGTVNTIGSNNLSLSHDDVLPLYGLIPTKTYYTPPNFLYSLSGNITSTTSCLDAHTANSTVNDTTTAGYFSYIPTLLCIEGELFNCDNGPVEDGTPIQICAVNVLDLGDDGILPNGVQKWVSTNVSTATNLKLNPAFMREPVRKEAGITLKELGISPASRSYDKMNIWFWLVVSLAVWLWL